MRWGRTNQRIDSVITTSVSKHITSRLAIWPTAERAVALPRLGARTWPWDHIHLSQELVAESPKLSKWMVMKFC
ncbi:hypothetical protein BS78_06G063100 [Paspalum vaginatum]|nr:hypothetical protein BS78_06G063100 [Paspalum vaginatum]